MKKKHHWSWLYEHHNRPDKEYPLWQKALGWAWLLLLVGGLLWFLVIAPLMVK